MEELNYEEDIKIDQQQLEVEWFKQAELALKYGKHYVYCKKEALRCEEKIKLVRSQLILKVTNFPEKYLKPGIKATGPIAEAYYRTHKKYLKAKTKWMEAVEEMDMAEIAKNAFSLTKKTALENLVKLYGQGYFAGPKVPRDLSEVYRGRKEKSDKEFNKKVGRRKNKNK